MVAKDWEKIGKIMWSIGIGIDIAFIAWLMVNRPSE